AGGEVGSSFFLRGVGEIERLPDALVETVPRFGDVFRERHAVAQRDVDGVGKPDAAGRPRAAGEVDLHRAALVGYERHGRQFGERVWDPLVFDVALRMPRLPPALMRNV